jgi:hypothetical protein
LSWTAPAIKSSQLILEQLAAIASGELLGWLGSRVAAPIRQKMMYTPRIPTQLVAAHVPRRRSVLVDSLIDSHVENDYLA